MSEASAGLKSRTSGLATQPISLLANLLTVLYHWKEQTGLLVGEKISLNAYQYPQALTWPGFRQTRGGLTCSFAGTSSESASRSSKRWTWPGPNSRGIPSLLGLKLK